MADERILYPCYFNAALTRREGRRVPQNAGVKGPVLQDLERAVKKLGMKYRAEDRNHPANWMRKEGRLVVEWSASKETLIKNVARQMRAKR